MFYQKSEKIKLFNDDIDVFLNHIKTIYKSKNKKDLFLIQKTEEILDTFIDKDKKTILIIDDNEGMVNFIRDDFVSILGDDFSNYNILTFTSPLAAYILIMYFEKINLKVELAIIDILLNGIVKTSEKNIKLTGVDVFEYLKQKTKIQNFFFYTGNQLNTDITFVRQMVEQFKKITGKNIEDFTIYKTTIDMEERHKLFKEKLFNL